MEVYSAYGVDYYILSNYEQLRIVWINQNYECSIIGPISLTDAKRMINSIGVHKNEKSNSTISSDNSHFPHTGNNFSPYCLCDG